MIFYGAIFCIISIGGFFLVPIAFYSILACFFVWLAYGLYCNGAETKRKAQEKERSKSFVRGKVVAEKRAEQNRQGYKREGFAEWSRELFAGEDSE